MPKKIGVSRVFAAGIRSAEGVSKYDPPQGLDAFRDAYQLRNYAGPRMYSWRRLPWGYVPSLVPQHFDLHDPTTLEQALFGRLYRNLPPVDPTELDHWSECATKVFRKWDLPPAQPPSMATWINSLRHPEWRKQQLRNAAEKIHWKFPYPSLLMRGDAFGKRETAVDYSRPRLIMSRSDTGKVVIGPMIHAVEERVYPLPCFTKGMTPEEIMEEIIGLKRMRFKHYYVSDYSSFESSEGPEKKERAEFKLYKQILGNQVFVDLLLNVLRTSVKFHTRRRELKILLRNFRYSGEVDTSCGNGIMNFVTSFYVVYVAYDRDFELAWANFSGKFEGDDGIFGTNRALDATVYERLGFSIKLEEVDDPCTASYCGLVFAESGQVIREPRKVLQKFGWTPNCLYAGDKVLRELLKAKAMSAICVAPHCPITGVLAREALKRCKNVHARFDPTEYVTYDKKNLLVEFAPTYETRLLYSKMFGITPQQQINAEEAIRAGHVEYLAQLFPASPAMLHYQRAYVVTQRRGVDPY